MAVMLTALCLLAWPLAGHASGSVDRVSVSSMAPQWIKQASEPVAMLGINLFSQSGTGKLMNLTVNFTDYGSDGGFNSSDLAPLSLDVTSGVALYVDNKTTGSPGAFDKSDALAPISPKPVWESSGGNLSTSIFTSGLAVPNNDLGNNSGPDFFVVVRTGQRASDGDDFTVSIVTGGIFADDGPLSFETVETGPIRVDAVRPVAEAGADLTVDEMVAASFYGGASTDNAGIANYTWFFGDFAADCLAYGAAASHTFSLPGKYVVVLNVSDHAGNRDEDTLLVTVNNVNQPPVLITSPPTTAIQGETYFYLFQAIDPDGDTLKYSMVEGPPDMTLDSSLGLVVWTPGPYDVRAWRVILTVTDGKSNPARQAFYISVQNVNDPPGFTSLPVLIAMQGQAYTYQSTVVDPDFDTQIVFSVIAGPRGMSITPYTGCVTWTPAYDQVGLNRVVLGATDGQLWGYQDFVINVTNANDAPVIQSMPVAAALQGAPYKYQVQAFDPDGDAITYYLSAWPTNMSIDPVDGLISWVPASDQVGPAFVRLEVMDGHGGVSNQSFYIMVANVNDPPVISSASPSPASEGTPWTYRLAAWDPDGDQVNFSLLSAPYGMIINSSSWQLEWVPGQETVGRNQVVLLASDGLGGLAVQSLTVIVQDVNDPPVALGSIAPDAFQGQPYITHVNAYDPDGDTLTYSLVTQLPNMAIDRHTGVLVWYPARPQVGDYHIAVRISDLNGSYTDAIFNVTVHPSNDPPEVGPLGVLRATAGTRLRFRVPASDPNGDRLLFTSTSRLFRINATTGEISFVPGDDDVGTHEFSVDVIDAGGLNATTSGVIVISGRPAGMPPARLAGYGLAGLGGFTPWLIIVIMIMVLGLLGAESVRLRRLELLEEKAAAQAEAPEVPVIPGGTPAQGHKIRAAPTVPVADRSWQRAAVQPKVKRIKKVKGMARCGLCGREISIKMGSDNYACSCGARYHTKCFQKAGICPECGRGRNERGKKA